MRLEAIFMIEFATLEGIQEYAVTDTILNIRISGDCMERRNIYDGDIVSVDLTKMPINKDICLMHDKKLGCIGTKEYIGAWGNMQMVSTCPKVNFDKGIHGGWAFPASHILGVVYACYDSTLNLKWKRDITGRPAELSRKQVIKGVNVNTPHK
jgi:hypothetical protein